MSKLSSNIDEKHVFAQIFIIIIIIYNLTSIFYAGMGSTGFWEQTSILLCPEPRHTVYSTLWDIMVHHTHLYHITHNTHPIDPSM